MRPKSEFSVESFWKLFSTLEKFWLLFWPSGDNLIKPVLFTTNEGTAQSTAFVLGKHFQRSRKLLSKVGAYLNVTTAHRVGSWISLASNRLD